MSKLASFKPQKKHLNHVISDWRKILLMDKGLSDGRLLDGLQNYLVDKTSSVVLLGNTELATYISAYLDKLDFQVVTDDHSIDIRESYLNTVSLLASDRDDQTFLVCEADRLNAELICSRISKHVVIDFDVFADNILESIPEDSWCESYPHIYPIDIPDIDFLPGLDALILDTPARSIAQLPVGFAYVYKALKQTNLNIQAVDLDIITYHRYHMRRCKNQWKEVMFEGEVHPEDPWQAASYLFWTSEKTLKYFDSILEEISQKIVSARPKVLGFSLHQTSHRFIKSIYDRVKKELPNTIVVVGGMSCYQSIIANKVFPEADYVVVGESDVVVGPLLGALARGERPKDLPGIISKEDTPGRTFIGAPLPHNLDALGRPDYGFTQLDLYKNWNDYRLMPLVGSRGCGWSRCTFCAERFNWRSRTPEKVAEEIEHYTTKGFSAFVFNESDFNSNHEFVRRLCRDIIRRKLNVQLSAQLRISKHSDLEYFSLMKKAGFTCLRFGIDGLSENTLRLQRKGYRLKDVRNNLHDCHKVGIYTEINVVIGVPFETDADIDETCDFLIEMKSFIGRVAFINPLMMFVGSVYYNDPEQFSIKFNIPKERIYNDYVVALPDDTWYSENPLIDHEVRHNRYFKVVERLADADVPMGDFAKFTANHRREKGQDPHVVASSDLAFSSTDHGSEKKTIVNIIPMQGADCNTRSAPQEEGNSIPNNVPSTQVVKCGSSFFRSGTIIDGHMKGVPYSDNPILLGSHLEYNLVLYKDKIYGAPRNIGKLNLADKNDRVRSELIIGSSEKEVVFKIDARLTAINY